MKFIDVICEMIKDSGVSVLKEQNYTVNYIVLNYEYDESGEFNFLVTFLLEILVDQKSYVYQFRLGASVNEDDDWEIDEERVDWEILKGGNKLKSVNGHEINLEVSKEQIEEVVLSTDTSALEDKISEIHHEIE